MCPKPKGFEHVPRRYRLVIRWDNGMPMEVQSGAPLDWQPKYRKIANQYGVCKFVRKDGK